MIYFRKGGDKMDVTATKTNNNASINLLFSLLDEAIDDYENGNVISEEEMLAELSSVETED